MIEIPEVQPPAGWTRAEYYLATVEPLACVVRAEPCSWPSLASCGYVGYVCVTRSLADPDVSPLRRLASYQFQDLQGRAAPDHPQTEESALRVVVEAVTATLRRRAGVILHSTDGTDRTATVVACTLRNLGHPVAQTMDYMGRLSVSRSAHPTWRTWPECRWQATLVERWTLDKEESLLREAARLLARGRSPGALKAFRSLIELAPHRVEGHLGLARVLEATGRHEEIVERLEPVAASIGAQEVSNALERARRALAAGRLELAKKTVVDVLSERLTHVSDPSVFEDDILLRCVHDLEESEIDWLMVELGRREYAEKVKTMIFWMLRGGDARGRAAKAIGNPALETVEGASSPRGMWRRTQGR